MKSRLANLREVLGTGFWLVPTFMTLIAVGLAVLTVHLDRKAESVGRWWLWRGGTDGARELLSAIASSMITVAGVVFSVTIVVLTLAASQFGPRLLRNFMQDRSNQVVLGTFLSTFVFSLVVLRTVRSTEGHFVPDLSVNVAILLALLSIGVLIFFIHHISTSIQADNLVAGVGDEMAWRIDTLFPEKLGEAAENGSEPDSQTDRPDDLGELTQTVTAPASGYVQTIENESLIALATAHNLLIRLLYRPGDFVVQGTPLMRLRAAQQSDYPALAAELAATFIIGPYRTPTQDAEYPMQQMLAIALRALSPGINDPYTAIICIDWLGAGLERLATRKIPSIYRHDDQKTLRVIAKTTSFPDLADAAFNPLRQYGAGSVLVSLRLLETIAHLATRVVRSEDRRALGQHATLIHDDAIAAPSNARDQDKIERVYRTTLDALAGTGAGRPGALQGNEESNKG